MSRLVLVLTDVCILLSPYDIGDRVFIGGELIYMTVFLAFFADENLVVKKVGLFATVSTRSDGTETYLVNSQLFNQFM